MLSTSFGAELSLMLHRNRHKNHIDLLQKHGSKLLPTLNLSHMWEPEIFYTKGVALTKEESNILPEAS